MGAEPSLRLEGKIPPGWMPLSHTEAILQTKSIQLAALVEVNSERLSWAGRYYGTTALYTDCTRMLSEVAPDIVSVATRTPEKRDIMRQAILAGVRGVYVEKPIANNLNDANAILELASSHGTHIGYGVNRRYHTVYRQAREVIRAGDIGDVLEVIAEFGETSLLWSHPHSVDIMIFLTGQKPCEAWAELVPVSVNQVADKVIDSDPVVTHAQFWFEGGARGIILRGGGGNVKVNGTRGSVEILSDGASLQIKRSTRSAASYFLHQEIVHPLAFQSGTVVAMEELSVAVSTQAPFQGITNDEIRWGMEMLIGCVQSHMMGSQRCALATLPPELTVTGKSGALYA